MSSSARCLCLQHISVLRQIFLRAVESVQPKSLFAVNKSIVQLQQNVLIVGVPNNNIISGSREQSKSTSMSIAATPQRDEIDLSGKQCHLVGFGKAVLGMAVQIEQLLGDRLVSGVLSVPLGTRDKFKDDPDMRLRADSVIEVYEGAANNLPDELAAASARRILQKCKEMSDADVLIVLISGGGSALIALPTDPITIAEKRSLCQTLASRQADIGELNVVRTALSETKGGKLAIAAANAHRCVSLVLSDVCGDPLDVIASGPTYRSLPVATMLKAQEVLSKYNMTQELPESVQTVLQAKQKVTIGDFPQNSSIHVIGSNRMACAAALAEANAQNLRPVILSTEVVGNVDKLSHTYMALIRMICEYRTDTIDHDEWNRQLADLAMQLHFIDGAAQVLTNLVRDKRDCRALCLIAGGETTVEIRGSGRGGRNQELALRLSALLHQDDRMSDGVMVLAAGTDGIDGPTTAAGALAYGQVIEQSRAAGMDASAYLANNDSFNFYTELDRGRYHIVTGLTGTNVMDLHVMVIPM